MSGGFQNQVSVQPAPGVAGDFCDTNPRVSVDAGPGGLVSGAAGVTIGRFAWANYSGIDGDNAPAIVSNNGSGSVTGFVPRVQQGLITTYLADASMVIPQGFQMALMSAGSFWAKNDGTTQALVGQTAYANYADGKVTFAAANAASITGSIAAGTGSVTGSISGNILTVTAGSGLVVGAILSGTAGAGVATNTQIVALLSGTGSSGTYALSIPEQTIPSGTITATYGILTAGTIGSGTLGVGDLLSGTGGGGVSTGTVITALGTGAGGVGTYYVNLTQTVTSTTIVAAGNVATKFVAMSSGLAGELVKISSWLLG